MSTLGDESRRLLEVTARSSAAAAPSIPDVEVKAEPNYRALAVTFVIAATVIRYACVARIPLGNGEAYYYTWSRFLDWSYYDHPPLLAWAVRVATLFGSSASPTCAAVRLVPVLASGAFGYFAYRLGERLFTPRAAFLSLVLLTALPNFLVSSFVLNPEAVLAPFWVGYLLTLEGMRERDEWYRPLLAGALLGVAFLAKYTAFLLAPATLLYLACSAPARRWLRRPSLYAGALVALLVACPVIFWNVARGWPSLQLHFQERAAVAVPVAGENTVNHLVEIASSEEAGFLGRFARVLVGQLMAYSPLLAPLLAIALGRILFRARKDDRDLFLTVFSWPVLLFLLVTMTKLKDAEQHWTMVGFIPAAIAAGRFADEAWTSARRLPFVGMAGAAVSGIVFLVALVHAHTNAILRLLPADHYDPKADMTNELVGWDQVRASVEDAVTQARARVPGKVVLAANQYALCGRLMFETGDSPAVYCPQPRRSAYDFFARRDPPADATVIALTNDIHSGLPSGLGDRECSAPQEVVIDRAGRAVAHYFLSTCAPVQPELEKRASRD